MNHLIGLSLLADAANAAPVAKPVDLWWTLLMLVALCVLPYVVGAFVARSLRLKEFSNRIGTVLLSLLTSVPVRAEGPTLGQPAPPFTLADLGGKSLRLEEFRGKKAVVVNFWATWCVPCRDEMPTLERLWQERQGSLEVLGVSVDVGDPERVKSFVRAVGVTFPILLDPEGKAGRPYRIRALPTSFVIDRSGILRYREIGYRDWTSSETRYFLDEALRPR